MEKHVLSKSTFIRGLQCVKSLYLFKNNFHQRDQLSATQEAIFSRGNSVGIFARQLFPGGIDSSPSSKFKYEEAITKTSELIEANCSAIYEACFQFSGVYAALDILKIVDGKYFAYEVKSSAKITAAYIMDAALQYFVITQSGIKLEDFHIIFVDTKYVLGKKIDPHKFFTSKSVINEILPLQDSIALKVQELKDVLKSPQMPDVKIGEHCHTPYSCDFLGMCRGKITSDSVFYLSNSTKQAQYELHRSGVKNIQDISPDFKFTEEQKIQYESIRSGNSYISKVDILEFVNSIKYPLYFLDFEIFMPAIPIFEGTSPYQHIPFLYSVHKKTKKNAALEHIYFLAETGHNPTRDFISQLILDMGNSGDILIFDATHEIKILNKAMHLFPELKNQLKEILLRIRDLSIPFQKKYFYTIEMKGSYSMKSLLPAIAPELSFENLKIRNGVSALTAFEKLGTEEDLFNIAETRDALKEYCKMDTLGLVKIFEMLESLAFEN